MRQPKYTQNLEAIAAMRYPDPSREDGFTIQQALGLSLLLIDFYLAGEGAQRGRRSGFYRELSQAARVLREHQEALAG